MTEDKEISIRKTLDSIEGYFLLKMFDEALAEVKRLLKLDKGSLFGHYYEGVIYLEKKDYRSAQKPFLEVLKSKPDMAEAYVHLAFIYRRTESLKKAIETIKKALLINPDFAIANYNIACYYSQSRNVDAAVDYLRRAIGRESSYIELAKKDEDFNSIRKNDKFRWLIYKKGKAKPSG